MNSPSPAPAPAATAPATGPGAAPSAVPAPPQLAVSTAIFALLPDAHGVRRLHLPLVRRTREPWADRWALPGGWVGADESLSGAARRTLAETTGLRPSYLEQLYTFGRPERSPTGRVISVVYTALVRNHLASAVEVGENVAWVPADGVSGLAFDHDEIVGYGLWRLRTKVEHASIALHFLDDLFTLAQLREVHEAVLQKELDPANFRRQVESSGTIVPTDEVRTGGRHRPPRLYRAVVPEGAAAWGYPPWQRDGPPA